MKDIEKRKPKYAAAEFWGGKKKEWVNGKQQEVETDGWFEEMCLKTIKREVYSTKHLPLDPKKIDDDYQHMKMRESQLNDSTIQYELLDAEVDENQATEVLDIEAPKEIEQVEYETVAVTEDEELPEFLADGPEF